MAAFMAVPHRRTPRESGCAAAFAEPLMAWSRVSRHARGYGTAWDRKRKRILKRDQHLCQPCLSADRLTPASQVDHITSKAKGGTDDDDNLQAICGPCHEAKTIAEKGGTVRRPIGEDGWPIE